MPHISNRYRAKQQGLKPRYFCAPATFLFAIILSLLSFVTCATQSDKTTLIIYQKSQGFSQQLIGQLESGISSKGYQVYKMLITLDKDLSPADIITLNEQHLLITIGSQVTEKILHTNIQKPILSALIPRHIAKSLHSRYAEKKDWSCLLIDQPIDRQLNLISVILGANKSTGVLLGPFTQDLQSNLTELALLPAHNINIKEVTSAKELTSSLNSLSKTSDVLLTLPDPIIYNKKTIRGILLSAYRKKLPIIGFSKAYVKAGAIAAVYSKPTQISKQLSSIANDYFNHNKFEKKRHFPDDFSVALNINIARSLGIELENNQAIIKKIKMTEVSR